MEKVIEDIKKERQKQDDKWGKNRNLHPAVWHVILSEEVGEVAKEVCDSGFTAESLSENYRNELIQVAAVAVAAIEAYDNFKANERTRQ